VLLYDGKRRIEVHTRFAAHCAARLHVLLRLRLDAPETTICTLHVVADRPAIGGGRSRK